MKKVFIALMAFVLVGASSADALRTHIETQNKKVCRAIMARNIVAFNAAMKGDVAKNFVYTDGGMTMNYQQMVKNMKAGFAQMTKMTKVTSRIVSLKEKGDSAVCLSSQMMEGMTKDPQGKKHTMGFSGISQYTYKKVGGNWLLTGMSWKSQSMTMDGKTTKM